MPALKSILAAGCLLALPLLLTDVRSQDPIVLPGPIAQTDAPPDGIDQPQDRIGFFAFIHHDS